MHDFSELEPTTKEMAVAILVIVAVLVAVFIAGYSIGVGNAGTDIHDNGKRIDDIREQLGTAIINQQQITNGLESAIERSDTAAARAGRIEERAGAAAQSVGEAGRLLDECQQIIGRIRNRGQKGTSAN